MSKREVEILTNKLKSLELKQDNLTSEIAKARREIKRLHKADHEEREEIIKGSGLYHGDKVVILNPSPNQETR